MDNILDSEFDWFGIDRDKNIGHFSSAGFGPVPVIVQANIHEYLKISEYLSNTPGTRPAKLLNSDGERDDWLQVSMHGIYSYDFQHWDGPYVKVARPEQPITLTDFPPDLAAIIGKVAFTQITFRTQSIIDPIAFFQC